MSQRLQTSAEINDRNPDHPQNLRNWSLARNTPLVKLLCKSVENTKSGSWIRIVIRIISKIELVVHWPETHGKKSMQICLLPVTKSDGQTDRQPAYLGGGGGGVGTDTGHYSLVTAV